jgi:hypothetical protein
MTDPADTIRMLKDAIRRHREQVSPLHVAVSDANRFDEELWDMLGDDDD